MAGMSFAELARHTHTALPDSSLSGKGWFGQCAEKYLDATAASTPQPDFVELGVELKTLPLTTDSRPKESTYVCTVPANLTGETWENCWLRKKLANVLWLPYQADTSKDWANRRIGTAILWSPSKEQNQALARDWEELITVMSLGQTDQLSSHHGQFLQIRPKATNARSVTRMIDQEGDASPTLPRGLYLRTAFTRQILEQNYL